LCDATSSQEHWADGSARHDEAEVVNEDGGDILDEGEETLGWAANVGQLALGQTTADGDATALERHGKGFVRSGGDDLEPSLGAPEVAFGRHEPFRVDQTYWAGGGLSDLELNDIDKPADLDGLHEQLAGTGLVPALDWTAGGYVG